MDFLDPKKKRSHRTRLYVGYGLTAVALAIATFILVFAAYGYDIDRSTGGIIQNGLLVVDAHPEPAEVFINQISKGTTSTRLVLPAGGYGVKLQRNGYRNWEHQITLEGSSIEQIVYPFLFPSKLITKTVQDYTAPPAMVSASPDRHWLVVMPTNKEASFTVIDTTNNKNTSTSISVPAEIMSTPEDSAFEPVEWSSDNVHLLLKHSFGGGSEYIVLDRGNGAASLNINKFFPDQPFTSLSLRDKKPDQFYMLNNQNGNLFQADQQAKTVSLIQTHVLSYKSYQADVLAYVTNPSNSTTLAELHLLQNKYDHLVRTLPMSPVYLLDMAQFDGHLYVASGSQSDGHTYVYKDPFDDFNHHPARTPQPFRVLIVPGAEYVSFSKVARFISVQRGSNFAVYDIETSRQFRYDIKLSVPDHQKASWMDGHRLIMMSDSKVNVFDFDGTNKQSLSPGLGTFSPFFDRDYSAMFTIAPVPNVQDKTTLTRTELKVITTKPSNQ